METGKQTIKMKRTIQVERERSFAALTEASHLREWLCDEARGEPRPGGRYTLRWLSGYEVQGTFVEVEPPEEVTMVWQGLGEPGQTLVGWELEEADSGTEVTLKHVGFGSGPRWETAYAEAQKGWAEALENLQSVLEKGVDLREVRQPSLDVVLDYVAPKRAGREDIATRKGVRIKMVIEEGAGEAAGLREGDILVTVRGRKVTDWSSLLAALRPFRGGDTVEVELVRGQERLTVPVTLKEQKLRPVPDDPAEAAAQLRELHARYNAALAEATAGLSEEQAQQPPAGGEWSVVEVLVHLILVERVVPQLMTWIALGFTLEGEIGSLVMWPDLVAATIATEPTVKGMLERFARDQEDSALLVEHLSETTRADRYRYQAIVRTPFWFGEFHTEDHIEQIRRTVEAVRGRTD